MIKRLAIKDNEMKMCEFNLTPGVINGYIQPKKRKTAYLSNITTNNQIIGSEKIRDDKLELSTYLIEEAKQQIPIQIDDVIFPNKNIINIEIDKENITDTEFDDNINFEIKKNNKNFKKSVFIHKKSPFKTKDEIDRILSWDISSLKVLGTTHELLLVENITSDFPSINAYALHFKNLLLEEIRSQLHDIIVKYIREMLKIPNNHGKLHSMKAVDKFCLATFNIKIENKEDYKQNDLVLLSDYSLNMRYGMKELKKAILGLVTSAKTNPINNKLQEVKIRISNDSCESNLAPVFRINEIYCISNIYQMTAEVREIRGLSTLHKIHFPLLKTILNPSLNRPKILNLNYLDIDLDLLQIIENNFNQYQQIAIATSIASQNKIILIQGPPGTGKTTAILGILRLFPSYFKYINIKDKITLACSNVRILVCAQSNTALDEIIIRIANNNILWKNTKYPNMVRLGKLSMTRDKALSYHIDTICENEINKNEEYSKLSERLDLFTQILKSLKNNLKKAKEDLVKQEYINNNINEKEKISEKIYSYNKNYEEQKKKVKEIITKIATHKEKFRRQCVRNADIIFCTLSNTAGDLQYMCRNQGKEDHIKFDMVIVDEASQALESSSILPLYLLKKEGSIVMIGDPKQLPPTVISRIACNRCYERSLFERLQSTGYPLVLLKEQYRMHPEISKISSNLFYENKLINSPCLTDEMLSRSYHEHKCFKPFVLYDCLEGRQVQLKGDTSYKNEEEAIIVSILIKTVKKYYKSDVNTIAVITPYKSQVKCLKEKILHFLKLKKTKNSKILEDMNIRISTIDSFQGQESDIVIISTVRSKMDSADSQIEFLADHRRINVAITRAQRALWIVGNVDTLIIEDIWVKLVRHAIHNNCVISAKKPYSELAESWNQEHFRK